MSESTVSSTSASISRERWQTFEPLLDAALALPLAERDRFLNQTCETDAALRHELDRMLETCDRLERGDPLLSRPAAERFASLLDETSELPRLESALANRYRFDGETGRGGMAVVYRAHDLRHGRPVALKVLRGTPGERGAASFRREIALAANLQHPHIVPVFDSGESDGRLWYTMPFVEGETLGARLRRHGRLPIADAVLIIREIADALAYAHARGVVHRDLKPDNVLLSGGHAMIADFGIARALASPLETVQAGSESSNPTIPLPDAPPIPYSLHAGTPAYMAPEQVTDQAIDHRADLYALGIIAYELLAGAPPFTAATRQALFDAHLRTAPPALSARRAEVSPGLDRLVTRLLAKQASDRPRSAADVLTELDALPTLPLRATPWWRTRVLAFATAVVLISVAGFTLWRRAQISLPPMRRVLVVPLQNTSADTSLSSFGIEAATWIAENLSQSEFVEVASNFTRRDALLAPDIATAAAETNARLVVSGSYLIDGDSIRAQIQITDVVTRTLLPGSKVISAARSARGTALAKLGSEALVMLATRLDPRIAEWSMGSPSQNMDAYRAFLDGLDENARGNHAEGIAQWMRAADLDSTYMQPLLHAAAMLSGAAPATADSLVRRVARRRVSLTPGDRAWLEAIRANIDGNTQRFFDASYDIIRAEPGAMLPYFFVGIGGVRLNRPNAALEAATHVNYKSGRFKLQWAGEVFSFVVAEANHQLGRYTRELEWTREVRDLHPDNRNPVAWTLRALAALGDTNAMDSVLTKLEAMPPTSYGPPLATHFLTIAGELGFHGHPVEAERFLRHAAEWQRNHATEVVPPGNARFEFARTLFFLAQFEEARSLLDSLLRADPANPLYLAYGAVSAARTGDSVTASVLRARLDTLRRPFDHGFTPYAKALVAAQMGHTAAALTYLEASSGQGMPPDLMSIHADLMLAPLWPNERYRALLRPKD